MNAEPTGSADGLEVQSEREREIERHLRFLLGAAGYYSVRWGQEEIQSLV